MSKRFKVVKGSQSCHCCFEYTVVDTSKPVMIGDEHYKDQFEPVCETFEKGEAELICISLNARADEIG
jgi:hypothetical protein